MRVIIASENPTKITAAEQAFRDYFPKEDIEIITQSTESGVSDQPMSQEETAQGAYNRAVGAADSDADFAVGIEGGLNFVSLNGREYAFEQTWAYVIDCKTKEGEIGSGPAYPIPEHVIAQIHQGNNLSDAMLAEYGIEDIGKNAGYNGWLSRDTLDRTETSRIAAYLALCGLMKDEYKNGN